MQQRLRWLLAILAVVAVVSLIDFNISWRLHHQSAPGLRLAINGLGAFILLVLFLLLGSKRK